MVLFSPKVKKWGSHSMQARKVTDAVAQFIVSDLQPVIVVVDGLGFLNLMEVAQPLYSVPCRRTIMKVIRYKYTSTKRNVRGLISQQESQCLTMDMWMSRAGNGFFSLTAHFLSPKFTMESKTLHCHHMPGSHDHASISQAVGLCAVEWCFDLVRLLSLPTMPEI